MTGLSPALALALALSVSMLCPAHAHAQAQAQQCAEGRTPIAGRCCWPGQAFDVRTRACVGAPRCPAPLVAHGEACVAPLASTGSEAEAPAVTPPASEAPAPREPVAPPPTAPAVATSTSPSPATAPAVAAPSQWPAPPAGVVTTRARNPRWSRTGRDDGLVIAGVTLFAVSYLLAAIPIPAVWAGVHRTFFGEQPDVPYWPVAFVPLLPLVTQAGSTSSPYLFALPSTIGQFVGVGLVLAGVFAGREEVRFGPPTRTLRLRVGARGAAAGGALVELVF